MGGRIVEMDIHEWRSAEGDVGCLGDSGEVACDTHKMQMQCSVVALGWGDKGGQARQVEYEGTVALQQGGILLVLRGCFQREPEKPEKPCHSHCEATEPPTRVVVTAFHVVRPPIHLCTIHPTSQILTQSSLPSRCNTPAIVPR
jgi:hypothetical protein